MMKSILFTVFMLTLANSYSTASAADTNSELTGVYETGPTDGMSWAYAITLRQDGTASLKEPHPLPDGDGKIVEMQGTWQVNGKKVSVTFPGKSARRYEFKVNAKLGWDEASDCKPKKGSSLGMELIKAEEAYGGKFQPMTTYYRLWRSGDPKLDARRCTGG